MVGRKTSESGRRQSKMYYKHPLRHAIDRVGACTNDIANSMHVGTVDWAKLGRVAMFIGRSSAYLLCERVIVSGLLRSFLRECT